MYLFERYVMKETRNVVLMIVGFLIFIFTIYSAQRYLTDAANGTLALKAVFVIVFYKALIALEMLLPIGLYVATAISLGQLYSDSEITAAQAAGISPFRLYRGILLLAIPVGIACALLSMYGRPWAYAHIDQLMQQSQSSFDVSHLQANKFNIEDNGTMVHAQTITPTDNHIQNTFIYTTDKGVTKVFRSQVGSIDNTRPQAPIAHLQSGSAYTFEHGSNNDSQQTYRNLAINLKPAADDEEVRSKAKSMKTLDQSRDLSDIAERQWRQTRGINAVLMTLLAIPLSRVRPRQGRFSVLLPLALVFIVIFFAGNICRTLVSNGMLPPIIGVWLVSWVMLLGILYFWVRDSSLLKKWFK